MMPSSTRNSARAENRSERSSDTGLVFRLRWERGVSAPPGVLQILEELAVRRDHENIAFLADGALIGLQTTIERIELRMLGISGSIDRGGFGVRLTTDLQRSALRLGDDLGALAQRLRADADCFLLPFRTQ